MQSESSISIKIGFIEDDDTLRNALKAYCEQSERLDCLLAADSAEKFIKYANSKHKLDIVIIDIGLPGISGIQAIKFVKRLYPDAEILMLTIYNDYETVFQALQHGANGYLIKNLSLEEIEAHLIAIIDDGEVALSPQIARRIIQFFQAKKSIAFVQQSKHNLTPTEAQVIKYITQGLSYAEAANMLDISINGVRFHIKNIYKKLQIRSKGELIKMYVDGVFDFLS